MLRAADPIRVLMSVDAVGGVWRYAMTLGRELRRMDVETVYCVFGPPPDEAQCLEAETIGQLVKTGLPLDWMADGPDALRQVPEAISELASVWQADIIHLNLPSQAARLRTERPVVIVTHSCTRSWFRAVQGTDVPEDWLWQTDLNEDGFQRADIRIAPSRSHGEVTAQCYSGAAPVQTVNNGSDGLASLPGAREPFAYAAGRWWDRGKNGEILDEAAALTSCPILAIGSTEGPNGERFSFRHAKTAGPKPFETVQEIASRAGIFVSPSLYEPFGLAALEAARGGAALILADIPTYRELWNGAACFAPPHSPADFARHLDRLNGNETARLAWSRRAQKRAATLTPGRQAASMKSLYTGLLSPHRHVQEAS